MLRPTKKISKRELKQDSLITTYGLVTDFYEDNKKAINIAILSVLGILVIAMVFANNRKANNEKALTELGKVYSFYDNNQFQLAIDGVPERNIAGLASIVSNYGSTDGGELARFYLGNAYYNLGKYDEALEQFDDFSPSDDLMTIGRYSGLASCYQVKGMHEEAAKYFEKAARVNTNSVDAAENFFHAATSYAMAGKKDKARELFTRIKKEYPKSTYARDIDRHLAQVSV